MASPRAMGTALTTLVWILGEVLGGGAGEEVAGGEEGQGPIQWVEEGVMVADKVLNIIMLTSHMAIKSTTLSGFGGGDFYPMENHMNKMRGGYGDQVSLEGPFSRGIAGAVSGWASEAKAQKVEQQNRLAEKQAALFKHTNATMLPMLETGQLSDYKLQCGEEVHDVHKMILAARSPFFVEIMMKNPHQCVITNIDMETLKLLVKFMYTSLVDISNINPALIIKLLSAAETYQVAARHPLKFLCLTYVYRWRW